MIGKLRVMGWQKRSDESEPTSARQAGWVGTFPDARAQERSDESEPTGLRQARWVRTCPDALAPANPRARP